MTPDLRYDWSLSGIAQQIRNISRFWYFCVSSQKRSPIEEFCEGRGKSLLPAEPATIRAFIEHEVTAGKRPATIRRYIATIGRAHIGAAQRTCRAGPTQHRVLAERHRSGVDPAR
jgi:hypothetical protein